MQQLQYKKRYIANVVVSKNESTCSTKGLAHTNYVDRNFLISFSPAVCLLADIYWFICLGFLRYLSLTRPPKSKWTTFFMMFKAFQNNSAILYNPLNTLSSFFIISDPSNQRKTAWFGNHSKSVFLKFSFSEALSVCNASIEGLVNTFLIMQAQ